MKLDTLFVYLNYLYSLKIMSFSLTVKNHQHKMDLKADIKGSMQKTGDLHITLNGMDVNMENYPSRSHVPNGVANGKVNCTIEGL